MSLLRRNPRRDANEPAIVAALEHEGCFVTRLSLPLDLLVWTPFLERWVLLEVKVPGKKLRKSQEQFFDLHVAARTLGFMYRVSNETEALVAVGARSHDDHTGCRNCDGKGRVRRSIGVVQHGGPEEYRWSRCPGFARLGEDLALTKASG